MRDLTIYNHFYSNGLEIMKTNSSFFQLRFKGRLVGFIEKVCEVGKKVMYVIQVTVKGYEKLFCIHNLRYFYFLVHNLEKTLLEIFEKAQNNGQTWRDYYDAKIH